MFYYSLRLFFRIVTDLFWVLIFQIEQHSVENINLNNQ